MKAKTQSLHCTLKILNKVYSICFNEMNKDDSGIEKNKIHQKNTT